MQINQKKRLNQFFSLNAYFTSRVDGNLAFHVNDTHKNVISNHLTLAKKLHFKHNKLVYMKQMHSNSIHIVQDNNNFSSPPTSDALITDKIGTPLMVMCADCSPLLLYDDKQKVIAAVHAGRAGAFNNIVQIVIDTFIQKFHSKVQNIYVTIGPSIKMCCYEVGEEIVQEAQEKNFIYAIKKKNEKYFLDISLILESQLLNAGVLCKNIEISKECTSCLDHDYFSYRKDKNTGRFAGIISMQKT